MHSHRLILSLVLLASISAAQDEKERRTDAVEEYLEVLVTGQRLDPTVPEIKLKDVGSRNTFGPKRVRETGARSANDLALNLPGMSARPYNGGEASAPSFSTRGLPDDGLTEYVNIMIDGVPASPLPYGWTAFSFLPVTPDRIFGVDWIRGAFGVRYSPNTVGGILNLITPPIPTKPTFMSRLTVGSEGYTSAMIGGGGRVGDFSGSAHYVNRSGDGYRDDGGFAQQDGNFKFTWDIDDDRFLATSVSFMEDEHKAPGGLTVAQFDENRFDNARQENEFSGNRWVVDMVLHNDVGDTGWWEAYSYLSKTYRHLRAQRPHFGAAATITDWKDDSWFYAIGGRGRAVLGDHTLFAGVRYHQEWIPSWTLTSEAFPGGASTPTQDATFNTYSISAHVDDTWTVNEKLTVVLGVRLEWIPRTDGSDEIGGWSFQDEFFAVLPGVGASYALNSSLAAFANYHQGFRAPQAWGYAFTTGDRSLKFERGEVAEMGVRLIDCRNLSGAVTVWRTEYDDFGVFYSGFYENLGRILAYGTDFELEWRVPGVEGLTVLGSCTLQDSELKSGPNAGNDTPYAWNTKAAWRIRYERAGWRMSLGGNYVGDSFSDAANTSTPSADGTLGVNPSRVLWDAQVARDWELGENGHFDIAIGVTNLLDHDWFVHSRGGFFGGGMVAGPPRQGYASAQLQFNW
jgi:Fe(3+) dicitrate transport protein